jgi:hypothetical protein
MHFDIPSKVIRMSLITWLFSAIFGLTGISSLAGFAIHLISGNPDMALIYFVCLGGSLSMGWMFATCRQSV